MSPRLWTRAVLFSVAGAVLLLAGAPAIADHLLADQPRTSAGALGTAPFPLPGARHPERLDPALARSLRAAFADAAAAGVGLHVNSGWRSRKHQRELYVDAIEKYGSAAQARRWVLPPDESHHVPGDAVDVGPPDAVGWLDEHGEDYGLCRVYANEPWHFELLAPEPGSTCPPMLPHP